VGKHQTLGKKEGKKECFTVLSVHSKLMPMRGRFKDSLLQW